ncbi:uncharacterized protein LOC114721529 [Neltuma alba]|uniref:uncharacterized protein LOC114721529 n=1 Tax=Neltuma alba TaxID=207710 RepID=UPI0010A33307|nr:uncharacterized protein LOC114721529 [Prosopis alba]
MPVAGSEIITWQAKKRTYLKLFGLASKNKALKGQKGAGKWQEVCVKNSDDPLLGKFDKPLPCFGFGIGWISLLLGLVCPPIWYYATILHFNNYCLKDPGERTGLAASAIATSVSIYCLSKVLL